MFSLMNSSRKFIWFYLMNQHEIPLFIGGEAEGISQRTKERKEAEAGR